MNRTITTSQEEFSADMWQTFPAKKVRFF